MSNNLSVIKNQLMSDETIKLVALTLGNGSEQDITSSKKYAFGVYNEIKKTAGKSKGDLTVCSPQSIVDAMTDAARFRLMIDGRMLAHLVPYGKNVSFMPSYSGMMFKVQETYPDAQIHIEIVYDGDEVEKFTTPNGMWFSLKCKNIMSRDKQKIVGGICAVRYTDKGRLVEMCEIVSKDRLQTAQKASKAGMWSLHYEAMVKKTIAKAGLNYMFKSIQGLQELITYDNNQHHDLSLVSRARSSVLDNIERASETIVEEPITGEVLEPIDEADFNILLDDGEAASFGGTQSLHDWQTSVDRDALTDEQRQTLRDRYVNWLENAKHIDKEEEEACSI